MRLPLPSALKAQLGLRWAELRALGPAGFLRWHARLARLFWLDRRQRGAHRMLSEDELRATRKSSRVFVFGSGASLNAISGVEWRDIEAHDTLGFSGFVYQRSVRVDYQLIRGWVEVSQGSSKWLEQARDFAAVLRANRLFDHAVLVMQGEYQAQFCNALVGCRLISPGARIFRYRTARGEGPVSRSFRDGLRHSAGTLSDAVNFAYCMGWTEIVLAGVDLYDSRYFWLMEDETLTVDPTTGMLKAAERTVRGVRYDEAHSSARFGVVEQMARWREVFEEHSVRLSVYNPQSLLARVLPVFAPAVAVSQR